jgi:ribonuclease T1
VVPSRLPSPRQYSKSLALAITLTGSFLIGGAAWSKSSASDTVALSALPAEARDVDNRIRLGGPFVYAKDGSVFGNRERQLPGKSRGFYREYTVPTPGASDRGARRIVCGGLEPTRPKSCYYTADHYTSFLRIVK